MGADSGAAGGEGSQRSGGWKLTWEQSQVIQGVEAHMGAESGGKGVESHMGAKSLPRVPAYSTSKESCES